MTLVWATRGRSWGFRFIRTAGAPDPLPIYEDAFSSVEDEPEVFRRSQTLVALRFRDPDGRKDQSSRLIFHEFVLQGEMAEDLHSIEEGREKIWPLVADEYERIYDLTTPPEPQH